MDQPQEHLCGKNGQTYSIAAVTGPTSYTWTVPSGATFTMASNGRSISVNYGSGFTNTGNITVKANNACTSNATSVLAVSARTVQPGTISGNANVCKSNTSVTYSVAEVTGATSYTWTITGGATFVGKKKTLRDISIEFARGKSKNRPRNEPKLYDGKYPFVQTGDIRNSNHYITEYTQTYKPKLDLLKVGYGKKERSV